MSNSDKPKYKGPSDTVVAFGQSGVDSLIGTVAGAGIGAAGGALSHNENKRFWAKIARKINNVTQKQPIPKERWEIEHEISGISSSPEVIETAENFLKKNGAFKSEWHSISRGAKIAIGALAGAMILGTVMQITGWIRGAKKSRAARDQFEDLATENQALKLSLATIETRAAGAKSFTSALEKERAEAATVENTRSV